MTGAMETPDGYWRVEAWTRRHGKERFHWYRVLHGTTVVAPRAAIATVEHVLGAAYSTLRLIDADPPADVA